MRSRNIKPGFFRNEDLVELPYETRLLFAGLWLLADREGRLEDRPKKIKMEVFPGDNVDVDTLLDQLTQHAFVVRYTVGDAAVVQIVNFAKHQNPHPREIGSVLPAPDDAHAHVKPHLGSPRHGLGNAKVVPSNASSSLSLPSGPSGSSTAGAVGAQAALDLRQRLAVVENTKPKPPPYTAPDCPHRRVLALWSEVLPQLPQHLPDQWRGERAENLRARWRETAARERWPNADEGLDYLRRLFAYVGKSRFLTGREHDPRKRPFFIELAWLVVPENWAKVHEGKYEAQEAAA